VRGKLPDQRHHDGREAGRRSAAEGFRRHDSPNSPRKRLGVSGTCGAVTERSRARGDREGCMKLNQPNETVLRALARTLVFSRILHPLASEGSRMHFARGKICSRWCCSCSVSPDSRWRCSRQSPTRAPEVRKRAPQDDSEYRRRRGEAPYNAAEHVSSSHGRLRRGP
jgi:hypothetical protein